MWTGGRADRQTDITKLRTLKKTNNLPIINPGLKPTPKLALLQQCDRMLDQIHGVWKCGEEKSDIFTIQY
jgi:hypothetical protein